MKSLILSATAVMLYDGRALGGEFWCNLCNRRVEDAFWETHVKNHHNDHDDHGYYIGYPAPTRFYCPACKEEFDSCNLEEHMDETGNHKYAFWCRACDKRISVDAWLMHLWFEHTSPDIYKPVVRTGDGLVARSLNLNDACIGTNLFYCTSCDDKFSNSLRCRHLRGKHCDLLPKCALYCETCQRVVPTKEWNDHISKEHGNDFRENIFVCPRGYCYKFLKSSEIRSHKHQGWSYDCCETCGCVFSGDLLSHIKESHPGMGFECSCGKFFLTKNDSYWAADHRSMHMIWCEICQCNVEEKHMYNKHKCNGACKLIVSTDKVWKWEHSSNCDCIKKCPFSSDVCSYTECGVKGISSKVEKHISQHLAWNIATLENRIKYKECIEECRIDKGNGTIIHAPNCYSTRSLDPCVLCGERSIKEIHLIDEHGCSKKCFYLKGIKCHHVSCEEWVWREKCNTCGARNVKPKHFFDEFECGPECRLEQEIEDGWEYLYLCHRNHEGKNGIYSLGSRKMKK